MAELRSLLRALACRAVRFSPWERFFAKPAARSVRSGHCAGPGQSPGSRPAALSFAAARYPSTPASSPLPKRLQPRPSQDFQVPEMAPVNGEFFRLARMRTDPASRAAEFFASKRLSRKPAANPIRSGHFVGCAQNRGSRPAEPARGFSGLGAACRNPDQLLSFSDLLAPGRP